MDKKIVFIVIICLCLIFMSQFSWGSRDQVVNLSVTDMNRWVMPDSGWEILEYQGKTALRLKPGEGERIAWVKDFQFDDGIIELDIAAIPSYTGLVFRVKNDHVYEGIYFRPQNSRDSDSVKRGHTVQYIAPPQYTWYHFRDKNPEHYEAEADIPLQEWFHIKVKIKGTTAEVHVNDSPDPCLTINDLKHGLSRGSVGLWCGNSSGGTFANLSVQKTGSTDSDTENSRLYQERLMYNPQQEFLFNVFKNRRSVRRFKSDPVPQEHIIKILEIAASAPTSGNQQPWKFLVIQDRDKIEKLKQASLDAYLERIKRDRDLTEERIESMKSQYDERLRGYLSAPVYIIVLTDNNSTYPSYNEKDGSLAAGYLLIAAQALGYGTVFTTDSFPPGMTKKVFEIPDHFKQICFIPIGIPEGVPESKDKKPLRTLYVFEKLIQGVNYTLPVKRQEVKLDSDTLEQFIGTYQVNEETSISISMENNRIFIQAPGQPKLEIFSEEKDKFFLKIADVQITFQRNEQGKVTGMIIHQGGQNTPAQKIEK